MNIQEMQKEISDIIVKIRTEANNLEKGNKFVEHASEASEKALLAASHVIEAFSKSEQSMASLEQKIQAVDFTHYFDGLRKTVEDINANMASLTELTSSSTGNMQKAKEQIQELREKVLNDVTNLVASSIKLDEGLKELAAQSQTANKNTGEIARLLSEANLPNNLSLIRAEISECDQSTQNNLKLLKEALDTLTKRFDEVGFHQRLKDIEYSNVKFSSEQDSIRKSIESMVSQQALFLQQLKEQKQYSEVAQQELLKGLEATNAKIYIAIATGGLALVGVGVVLSKLL